MRSSTAGTASAIDRALQLVELVNLAGSPAMILIYWSTNPTVVKPGEPPKTVAKITRLLAAQIERAARRRPGYNSHLRGGVELCRTGVP